MQFFDLLNSSSSPVATRWAALFLEVSICSGRSLDRPGVAQPFLPALSEVEGAVLLRVNFTPNFISRGSHD
jgi:hypothetical protein